MNTGLNHPWNQGSGSWWWWLEWKYLMVIVGTRQHVLLYSHPLGLAPSLFCLACIVALASSL